MVGNLDRMKSAGLCVMSRYTHFAPLRFISASMARATMSRGASSRWGWAFSMKRWPRPLIKMPPSPRTASEMRNDLIEGW